MLSISIHYIKIAILFPQNLKLEVSELTTLFKVKEIEIHIRFLQSGACQRQYPGSFLSNLLCPLI